jgi:hypothetical protein
MIKLSEIVTQSDLKNIEKHADRILSPEDLEFSRHFFDRVNDPRNGKDITDQELMDFFTRLQKKKDAFQYFLDKYEKVTVTDRNTKINIPFVKRVDDIIATTVMRKADWKSQDKGKIKL